LFFMEQNKQITNYAHFLTRSNTERDRDAVEARKLMYDADRLKTKENEPDRAIAAYQKGFELWLKLLSNPQFVDFRNDTSILDSTYETEIKYVDLLRQRLGPQLRPAMVAGNLLNQSAAIATGAALPESLGMGILYSVVTDQKLLPIPL